MNKSTDVSVSGSLLTAGFHAANPPLIWRFDLERNHSFTLSLQGDEGDWELGSTSPRGDFFSIAHFDAREDAEEALFKVERALSRTRSGLGRLFKSLAIVLAVLAIVAVGTVAYFSYTSPAHRVTQLMDKVPPLKAPQNGVPMSADDVLVAPKE